MATYTDLGNRVRENVVVDYYTRETAQCVKLLNDTNEYRGIFKGAVEVSSATVKGGELSGVTLRDVEFVGRIELPGHADLAEIGNEVSELKLTTQEKFGQIDVSADHIAAALEKTAAALDERIAGERTSRENADSSLRQAIAEADAKQTGKAAAIEANLQSISSSMCSRDVVDDLRADIARDIDDVDLSVAALQIKTNSIVADLTALSSAATSLKADAAGETAMRIASDKQIEAEIAKHVDEAAAHMADVESRLEKRIDEIAADTDDTIAALAESAYSNTSKMRHYAISEDGMSQWPYRCDDFAVNVYKDAGPAAVVKHVGADNQTHSIGTMSPQSDGTMLFRTFAEIAPSEVAASIEPNREYYFPADGQAITTALGCRLQYRSASGGIGGEIAASPVAPQYCSLQCSGSQIGKIYDAAFDSDGNLLSGMLTIQTADPEFASFRGFYAKKFDLAENRVVQADTEQIEYLGGNKFELRSGIEARAKMHLTDRETGYEFATVLSSAAKSPVTYGSDGSIEKISATLQLPDADPLEVELNRISGFKREISCWTAAGGRSYKRTVRLETSGTAPEQVKFKIDSESVRRMMPIESIDAAGLLSGCLVPDVWNVDDLFMLDYSRVGKISAYVSAFVPVAEIQRGCYVLEKMETGSSCTCGCADGSVDTVFAANETSGGNSVEMKFTGRAFHIVVTTAEGKVLRYSQALQSRAEWPEFKPDTQRSTEFETDSMPVQFGAAYEDPSFSWSASADSRQQVDPRGDFTLAVAEAARRVELVLPNGISGHAREFITMVKPAGTEDLEVAFVDQRGQPLDPAIVFSRKYGAETSDVFTAPASKWTAFKVQEIRRGKFVVVDSLDAASKLVDKFEKTDADIISLSAAVDAWSADLAGRVDAEAQRAEAVENALSAAATLLSDAVAAEASRAAAAESSISADVSGLSTAAASISTGLADEAQRAEAIELSIARDTAELSASFENVAIDHGGRISELEHEAEATFAQTRFTAGGADVDTNLLKLIDIDDTTKTYTLLVKDGTLVLSAIEAAN